MMQGLRRGRCNGHWLVLYSLFFLLLFPIHANADETQISDRVSCDSSGLAILSNVRTSTEGRADSLLLIMALNRPVEPRIFYLPEPSRIVVDVPVRSIGSLPYRVPVDSQDVAKSLRAWEHRNRGKVRFVFDLYEGGDYAVEPRLYSPEGAPEETKLVVGVTRSNETASLEKEE